MIKKTYIRKQKIFIIERSIFFRDVWTIDDVFNTDSVWSALFIQLLSQQWRLQHMGESVRSAQVRRLLQGPTTEYVHTGDTRLVENCRTGHAESRLVIYSFNEKREII